MEKAIDFLADQLQGITKLGGGGEASLIGSVKAQYYSQTTPISHFAHVTRTGNRVSVTPHEPTFVPTVVKALQQAGFNAYQFSKDTAVVEVQPPSGDTKREKGQRIRTIGEETKVAIRNIRKRCKKSIEKEEIKELQDLTDKAISAVDEIIERKLSYL